MGNEHSQELARLAENLRELETALKSRHKTSTDDVIKHGWDERDKSPNISVSEGNQMAKRNSTKGTTDGIRGRIGYKGGVFLFEFEWHPGEDKHVAIGLATTKAPLKCEGRKALIGANDCSVGWDLVNRCIRFNDCKIKPYPDTEVLQVPSKVTMVLDMSEGTVAFRAGSKDYGVAMKGLKILSNGFYVAASLDEPGDSISMKYLGSLERVRNAMLSSASSPTHCLTFHDICGKNIRLSNGKRTAERKNSDDTIMYATAMTNRPIKDGETFAVRCDSRDKTKSGAWVVGATTVRPDDLDFPKEMTRCRQGKRWIYNEDKILHQNKLVHEVNINLDDLRSGAIVAIKKTSDELQFSVNGSRVAKVPLDTDEPIYGTVDLFGRTIKVALLDEDGNAPRDDDSSPSRHALGDSQKLIQSLLPQTNDQFIERLKPTLDRLEQKNPDKIGRVRQHLKINLLLPMELMKTMAMKNRAAGVLGETENCAKTMTEYLEFLMNRGLDTDEETRKTYSTLLDIIVTYSDKSLLLSRKFGESGLVKMLIQRLHKIKDNKHSAKDSEFVRTYFIVLHNCAKAAENRPIYRVCEFLRIGKHYCDIADDDMTPVIVSLTMSYICDDDQLHLLELSDKTAENIVHLLRKSADSERSDGAHKFQGCYCHELAVGITNLSRNPKNIEKFMSHDAVEHLIKMLGFSDAFDKECGLNGIWSLVTAENRRDVIKSGGLSLKLRSLASHERESVKQAAIRLLTRLVNMPESGKDTKPQKRQCEYWARCARFKKQLQLPAEYFDSSKDACYCAECHGMRGDEAYYSEGQPPKRYGVPVGWCKFALSLPPRALVHKVSEKWHRAYHGTKQEHVEGILNVGEIVPAGQPVLGGMKIVEGSGHFKSDWKPEGFDTKKVFLSPSIRYSGVDAYAKPKIYTDSSSGSTYIAKVAMQVLIAPNGYDVSPQTIGVTEEIDPGFSNQELEWSTNQLGSCILQGLLVKLKTADE